MEKEISKGRPQGMELAVQLTVGTKIHEKN